METKICTKCGQELPATTEYFYKDSTRLSGLNHYCKQCTNKHSKKYYQKNKEKLVEKIIQYNRDNKEKLKEYAQKYRQKNKKIISKKATLYYQNNKYIIKEKNKIYAKKKIKTLMPGYIAAKLNISVKDLTLELLEQKRLTILIKRELCK